VLEQLQRYGLVHLVKVRLDPYLHGPAKVLRGRHYRATIWGRPLDWNRIADLHEPEHGRWLPGKMSHRSFCTDYAWLPHDNEVDFVCEELPKQEEADYRGSRYLHAVYDKPQCRITHLDGAIRIYDNKEIVERAKLHVRSAGKMGTRTKVFRLDTPVETEVFAPLVEAFFFWNYDVARYFGAPIPDDF
jgi:hypothetical protein